MTLLVGTANEYCELLRHFFFTEMMITSGGLAQAWLLVESTDDSCVVAASAVFLDWALQMVDALPPCTIAQCNLCVSADCHFSHSQEPFHVTLSTFFSKLVIRITILILFTVYTSDIRRINEKHLEYVWTSVVSGSSWLVAGVQKLSNIYVKQFAPDGEVREWETV